MQAQHNSDHLENDVQIFLNDKYPEQKQEKQKGNGRKTRPKIQLPKDVQTWLRYCNRHFTKATCEKYQGYIEKFLWFTDNNLNVSVDIIELFLDSILRNCKRRTANGYLITLKSFYRWRTDHTEKENIAAHIKLLKEDPVRQRFIREDEYDKLLAVAEGMEKDILQFFANVGLRRKEFLTLKLENISTDKSHLDIIGKGRKRRIIPLNSIAKNILNKYPHLEFTQYKHPSYLNRMCEKLAKKADVEKFSVHSLRHYFATRLVKAGVSLVKVSKLLGHSDILTTFRVYLHLASEDIMDATFCLTK